MPFEQVQTIIANMLAVEKERVTLDAILVDDLNADSLDAVEIVMQIEEKFNIEIDDDAIQYIKTVDDIVKFIEKS